MEKKKKKRRKRREDDTNSDSDSSHNLLSSTESDNELDKIKRKRDKKLYKDTKLMVNSPFALAIRNAINRDPVRSKAVEAAFIARTARPRTTTIQMIYKDVSKIRWDHPALEATFGGQVNYQMEIFRGKDTEKYKLRRRTLQKEYSELRELLEQDKILINAQALFVILDSLWMQHTNMIGILGAYKEIRKSFLSIPENQCHLIGRLHGFCFGFNYRMEGCKNTNCSFWHYCPGHQAVKLPHPFMKCPDNANRWTDKELEAFKNKGKPNPYFKRNRYNNYKRYKNYDDNYKDKDVKFNRGYDQDRDHGYDRNERPRGNRNRYRGGRRYWFHKLVQSN